LEHPTVESINQKVFSDDTFKSTWHSTTECDGQTDRRTDIQHSPRYAQHRVHMRTPSCIFLKICVY